MEVAALVTWLVTAVGGFVLFGTWVAKGGHRRDAGQPSRFSPELIFGHFLLAAIGLVLWIVYVLADTEGLAWPAFAIVAVVAVLGFIMFFRWLPEVRDRRATAETAETAEAQFPVPVVIAHGLFAATTLVLVLLAAIAA